MNVPRQAARAVLLLFGVAQLSTPAGVASAQDRSFDLVVSLESNPLGDAARMQRYRDILQDFSDTLFQASEGAHAIGQVKIYTDGSAHDRADVIWQRSGHPKSTRNGIRGPGHIYMVDTFTGGAADGGDLPLTDDPDEAGSKAAGAVLAHEWAHYAYGLLDEHAIDSNDQPVSPSLMNSPWQVENFPEWANFSIQNSGGGAFQNTERTAHHRRYGVSAWELLASPPSLADALLAPIPGSVERSFYNELAMRAPPGLPATGEPPPTIPIPEFVTGCSNYVIAIDNSGSMTGLALNLAKGVAEILIDSFEADTTWVGLLTFGDTAVERTAGPTLVSDDPDLNGESERDRLQDRIDQIAALPVPTSFSAGLAAAKTLLDDADPFLAAASEPSCDPSAQATALFFVSDGSNGDPTGSESSDLANAIDLYASAGIPIYALDVGRFDPDATSNEMTPLVAASGGILTGPGAGFSQAQQSFREAESQRRPQLPLHESPFLEFTIPVSGAAGFVTFPVDEGIDRFSVCASTDVEVASLSLTSPTGLSFPPLAVRTSEAVAVGSDDCSTFWAVESPPGTGLWQITGERDPDATTDARVSTIANGSADGATFSLRAWVTNADAPTLTLPEPVTVTAELGRELPLVGARVFARLGNSGIEQLLRDDGIPPDADAGDGLYVGALTTDQELSDEPIFVRATNSLGIATLTSRGLVRSPNIGGAVIAPEDDIAVVGPLLRFATTRVSTVDPGMTPTIVDTNPVDGRIALSGEVDTFAIDLAMIGTGDLEIRVSGALLGMVPRLTVRDASGATIGEAQASSGSGGVTLPVQSSDGLVTAEVRHAGSGTGTYQISAGPRLGLSFGPGGLSDSPCDLALSDKNDALVALESGLPGVPAAILLIEESRSLERTLIEGIREGRGNGSTGRAGRFLNRAAKRDEKALKRLRKAEREGRGKELKGAQRKIRNARGKLRKACRRLADGGASLLP